MNSATSGMMSFSLRKSPQELACALQQQLQERREREGIPASNYEVWKQTMEDLAKRQAEIDEAYKQGKHL